MRAKDRIIIVCCLLIGGALLLLASVRVAPIQEARKEMGLVANEPLENAPPSLAFATVAMGAFRGLVVDILWMRADNLKQEGKFFDAKQLADWITLLQPRFAAVWDFQAWNMAYNISVAIPNTQPEERWRWVRNGYELLRDKGIKENPHSILLYRSLAWIFQHKIAGDSDDCHRYYKKELALSLRPLLGDNSPGYFERLVQAPQSLAEILADEQVAQLIHALQAAAPAFLKNDEIVASYLSLRQTPGRYPKAAFEVIDQYRDSAALEKFDVFARAWQLRNEWKFDIDFMIQLNKQYGPVEVTEPNDHLPLNWEHPATHAIYWAAKGLQSAGRPGQYRIDEKNTDRIIFHSLQMLFRRGKIVLYESPDKTTSEIYLFPDPRMFKSCDETWMQKIVKYENLEKGNPKAVRGGHKNLLEDAVLYFYQAGQQDMAMQLYQRLRTEHKMNQSGYFERDEYKVPFLTFVKNRWREEFEGLGIKDATQMTFTLLHESYFKYALHEDDAAATCENFAQEVYEKYQKEMGAEEQYRVGLPSLDRIRYQAFVQFLSNDMVPGEMRTSLLNRLQIERPDLYEKLRQEDIQFIEEMRQQQQQQQQNQL
ncbi:MAG: hypothetical protein ISS71_03555 [Phycisphaerae bacterium]|nr:hypothetical protein [Phycisphaerae bacterium]